jgi:hypothetical protein
MALLSSLQSSFANKDNMELKVAHIGEERKVYRASLLVLHSVLKAASQANVHVFSTDFTEHGIRGNLWCFVTSTPNGKSR